MIKKILKVIGSFLLVTILVISSIYIWILFEKEKQEALAKPYLNKSMIIFSKWDFNNMKVLLSPSTLKNFETKKGRKVYKMFSRLGNLEKIDNINFISSTIDLNNKYITFSILGHFENDYALIKIVLIESNDSYLINYIQITSDIFIR
ncbi:MAG: hypothetical protein HRT42_04965 [Campylobacteraceae bacterium]|nr:hypothetical protein [Campylobacteraceae bacterium]